MTDQFWMEGNDEDGLRAGCDCGWLGEWQDFGRLAAIDGDDHLATCHPRAVHELEVVDGAVDIDATRPVRRTLSCSLVDTDALRDALRIHHPIMRSETGPFSGCRCGQVGLGQDVIAHVVEQLRIALAEEAS